MRQMEKVNAPNVGAKEGRKCVQISQDGKQKRGGAGGMQIPHKYIPEYVSERTKRLCAAFGHNRDFCDFRPPSARGRKLHRMGLSGPIPLHFYQ
jgi:hypothetical protein